MSDNKVPGLFFLTRQQQWLGFQQWTHFITFLSIVC